MITGTTLHLNKSSSASDIMNYLKDGLAIGDYYREKGQTFGTWGGTLAPALGLDKDINFADEKQAFINLLQGRHPATGQLIKAHKARANGVAGYDFVASPDKSISVMAMFDARIIEAHQRANALALAEVEKNASRRMRSGPSHNRTELPNKFTGNMLRCSFQHDLSRANDPLLHTHNFIFNLTMDEDGNFYSLDQKEMKRSIRYFSTVYNSILAKELERLGYHMEPVQHQGRIVSFRLMDVSKEVCDIYSSRRQDILTEGEVYKEENKLDRALTEAERDIIARETRGNKKLVSEKEKLTVAKGKVSRDQWEALEDISKKALKAKPKAKEMDFEKAVNLAIEHLFERKSTVALREILAEVMTQHFGKLDFYDLQNYLSEEKNMAKHQLLDLELLRECPVAEKYVTTDRSLEREAYSVNVVNKGIEKCLPFNENFSPFSDQEFCRYEKENHVNFDSQRILVNEVLVSRDRYLNIQGKAGTGKTTMSKELVRGIEANGGDVIVLAPTNSAVDTLKENGFDAMTVTKFLYTFQKYDLSNTTILVDEAGLLSSRQGSQLLYLAEQNNCRIIFQGDTRQHSSVEAGDFVRGLEDYSKILTFSLSSINRQKNETYKEIVELLADNKTKNALELLDRNEGITERSDYIRSAVDEFKLEDFTVSGHCLYVATTNYEVDRLNEQIRAKVKSFGNDLLKNEVEKTIFIRSNMTVARSKQARSYNPGDYIHINRRFQSFRHGEYYRIENVDTKKNRIFLENGNFVNLDNHFADIVHGTQRDINIAEGEKIICTARNREHDLFNGEVLTIEKMHCKVDGENFVKCVNSNGKVKFMPQDFRHFKYGYAMTSHRSQGSTVDKVVVVAKDLNSESAYVALSRGRNDCQIHTPNKYELINNAMDYVRPLAMDIIDHDRKREQLKTVDHTKELERIEKDFRKAKEPKVKKDMMQQTFGFGKEISRDEALDSDKETPSKEHRKVTYQQEIKQPVEPEVAPDLPTSEIKKEQRELNWEMVKINNQLSWAETHQLPLNHYIGYKDVRPELIPTVEELKERKEIVLSRLAEIKEQSGIDKGKSIESSKVPAEKDIRKLPPAEIENSKQIKQEVDWQTMEFEEEQKPEKEPAVEISREQEKSKEHGFIVRRLAKAEKDLERACNRLEVISWAMTEIEQGQKELEGNLTRLKTELEESLATNLNLLLHPIKSVKTYNHEDQLKEEIIKQEKVLEKYISSHKREYEQLQNQNEELLEKRDKNKELIVELEQRLEKEFARKEKSFDWGSKSISKEFHEKAPAKAISKEKDHGFDIGFDR